MITWEIRRVLSLYIRKTRFLYGNMKKGHNNKNMLLVNIIAQEIVLEPQSTRFETQQTVLK